MGSIKWSLSSLMLLMLLLISNNAAAGYYCTPTKSTVTIPNSAAFTVSSTLAIGQEIGPLQQVTTTSTFTCNKDTYEPPISSHSIRLIPTAAMLFKASAGAINGKAANIYSFGGKTGIGYAIGGKATFSPSSNITLTDCNTDKNIINDTTKSVTLCTSGDFSKIPLNKVVQAQTTAYIQFYKVAELGNFNDDSNTGFTNRPVGTFEIAHNGSPQMEGGAVNINVGNFTVHETPCAISSTPITVELGNIPTTHFTGTGSTSTAMEFSIPLTECGNSTRTVNLKLAPTNGILTTTDNSVFALESTAAAKNVGIQILDSNDTPFDLTKKIPIKGTAGGNTQITLKARYYQTDTTVQAGTAGGQLNLELSYN